MSNPTLASEAWLVRIDLRALAGNLTRKCRRIFTDRDAARWLTHPIPFDLSIGRIKEMASPFRKTDAWGVFYTEETPDAWLEPDEILTIRETKPTREVMPAAGE